MSYLNGLAEAFGCLIVIGIIGICGFLGCGGYLLFSAKEIESKVLITPEVRLTTDGKNVDTLYIYKQK